MGGRVSKKGVVEKSKEPTVVVHGSTTKCPDALKTPTSPTEIKPVMPGLEYANSCYFPTDWVSVPLVKTSTMGRDAY